MKMIYLFYALLTASMFAFPEYLEWQVSIGLIGLIPVCAYVSFVGIPNHYKRLTAELVAETARMRDDNRTTQNNNGVRRSEA